jgi:hypothetical protein
MGRTKFKLALEEPPKKTFNSKLKLDILLKKKNHTTFVTTIGLKWTNSK